MKAYFFLIDVFENSWNMKNSTLKLKSYKIDNVETLTNEFFNETQNVICHSGTNDFYNCVASEDGTDAILNNNQGQANSFNPFSKSFLMEYPLINDAPRGLPTGTQNGLNNYGSGVMNIGVDIPFCLVGSQTNIGHEIGAVQFVNAPVFFDIDFTKDLYIEFDVVMTLNEGSPFEQPYIYQTFKIQFSTEKCKTSYSVTYPNSDVIINDSNVIDLVDYGFLIGITRDKYKEGISPFVEINCPDPETGCEFKELSRSFGVLVDIPSVSESPDEVFKECCYSHFVLADANSNDDYKNDYSGFYHQRQLQNETVDFVLVHLETNDEYNLNNGIFGDFMDFGSYVNNPNLKSFLLKWKKVLSEIGEGNFKVLKRQTIVGMTFEFPSITFTLKQFSTGRADKTIRVDALMNGFLEKTKVNFTGSNFKHSIRVPGFFGRRDPQATEDNLVNRFFEKKQISMKQSNEYKFQTNPIPVCLTDDFFDFFLYANDLFMNDYNLNNHSYNFKKFGVKYSNNDGTEYGNKTRNAILNFTFTDKFDNNLKRNYL